MLVVAQLGKGSKQLYLDTKVVTEHTKICWCKDPLLTSVADGNAWKQQAVQLKRKKQYLSWKEYYFTQQTFASLQKVAPTVSPIRNTKKQHRRRKDA